MSTIKYAGIGSRKTPEDICRKMSQASKTMAKLGFILRSGGAYGADDAFESGVAEAASELDKECVELAEIYLPWKGYRKNESPFFGSTKEARLIAKQYHPRWHIVSCAGRDFHARNVYQVLGRSLDQPSSFVLCWTPEGAITGGTGQALRIAQDYGVPILNFATDDDEYISDYILKTAERHNQS